VCGKQIALRCKRMAYEVIRITCQTESSTTRLVLEGKLAGACVDELDKYWQQVSLTGSTFLVDLTSVSFIDDRGKQLLKRMHDHGVKLVSTSLMSKCLIAEISH
jgi:anti-anti-sigma regulatory factor